MVKRIQAWWKELHRERTPERRGRRSRSGVAMLLVITIVTLLTVVVTEVVHGAAMRIQLAGNQRDEAKAEALAMSGVQFYRLLLIASQQLGSGFYNMLRTMLPEGMEAPITSDIACSPYTKCVSVTSDGSGIVRSIGAGFRVCGSMGGQPSVGHSPGRAGRHGAPARGSARAWPVPEVYSDAAAEPYLQRTHWGK